MTLCLAAGGTVLTLAVSSFTLSWTHSVQRTEWWERWEVTQDGLHPVEARISSTGAGMEPPPDAVRREDGWHYTPHVPPQKKIILGSSGMTGGGWTLCAADNCQVIGATAGDPIMIWVEDRCTAAP